MKLSEYLQKWRAERPGEWIMDNFIRQAKELENALKDLGSEYHDGKLCFCEMRIGNPMYDFHTEACKNARELSLDKTPQTMQQ